MHINICNIYTQIVILDITQVQSDKNKGTLDFDTAFLWSLKFCIPPSDKMNGYLKAISSQTIL